MVNEAIIIHVPNRPIIQFCHIASNFPFPSIHSRLRLPAGGRPAYGRQYKKTAKGE
jgi:hypothetical protein